MRTGRPRERAITLMDGFYIEVSNPGESKGLKIRSESRAAMSFPQSNIKDLKT